MDRKKDCPKCPGRQFGEEDYKKDLEKYISLIKAADRAEEEERKRRLEICAECGKNIQGTCIECGCYVEIRASLKTGRCPGRKWRQ